MNAEAQDLLSKVMQLTLEQFPVGEARAIPLSECRCNMTDGQLVAEVLRASGCYHAMATRTRGPAELMIKRLPLPQHLEQQLQQEWSMCHPTNMP